MRFFVLLVALFSLACGLFPSVPAPPQPAPATAGAVQPQVDPALLNEGVAAMLAEGTNDVATPVATKELTRPELVAAFLAQCDYEPQVMVDGIDGADSDAACRAFDFDQNCSEDFSGCWGALQTCKDECTVPCESCSGVCSGSCDTCKASCLGNPNGSECLRACAEARTTCHETCVSTRAKCMDVDCQTRATACSDQYESRVATECGAACQPYRECQGGADLSASTEKCEAAGAKLSEFCRNACSPYN